MSTLINIAMAMAAMLLSLTGVHRSEEIAPSKEIVKCQVMQQHPTAYFTIENEQLSHKIN